MDRLACNRVASILVTVTGNQPCYFYYVFPSAIEHHPGLLLEGTLDSAANGFAEMERPKHAPSYWWPENYAWCVYSDWDFTYTLVGGGQNLVDRIIADTYLEAIKVESSTRVGWGADSSNQGSK